ncbi:hypothetical protein F4604DRAFT_1964655 [Suillus subluteus]|nr:hypothetical protein F4604DRAFT_1964655 [Suillus subluteus]
MAPPWHFMAPSWPSSFLALLPGPSWLLPGPLPSWPFLALPGPPWSSLVPPWPPSPWFSPLALHGSSLTLPGPSLALPGPSWFLPGPPPPWPSLVLLPGPPWPFLEVLLSLLGQMELYNAMSFSGQFPDVVTSHGATDFLTALQSFIHKNLPGCTVVPGVQDCFDIYRQAVIVMPPDLRVSDIPTWRRIRATPEILSSGCKPGCPARFDMGLIFDGPHPARLQTLDGLRVAQVRAIFSLPCQFGTYTRALTYIEWFTPFRAPDPYSGMQQVSRSTRHCCRNAAVVHVDEIIRPCHLILKMGLSVEPRLRSGNAYEAANDFYFNEFIDGEMFCASVAIN